MPTVDFSVTTDAPVYGLSVAHDAGIQSVHFSLGAGAMDIAHGSVCDAVLFLGGPVDTTAKFKVTQGDTVLRSGEAKVTTRGRTRRFGFIVQ